MHPLEHRMALNHLGLSALSDATGRQTQDCLHRGGQRRPGARGRDARLRPELGNRRTLVPSSTATAFRECVLHAVLTAVSSGHPGTHPRVQALGGRRQLVPAGPIFVHSWWWCCWWWWCCCCWCSCCCCCCRCCRYRCCCCCCCELTTFTGTFQALAIIFESGIATATIMALALSVVWPDSEGEASCHCRRTLPRC